MKIKTLQRAIHDVLVRENPAYSVINLNRVHYTLNDDNTIMINANPEYRNTLRGLPLNVTITQRPNTDECLQLINLSGDNPLSKYNTVSSDLDTVGLVGYTLKNSAYNKQMNVKRKGGDVASLLAENGNISVLRFVETDSTHEPNGKIKGMMLDIARKFYTVDQIKLFMDAAYDAGCEYFHLHLTDDQNYALEFSECQSAETYPKDETGGHYNTDLGKYFLSYADLNDLINYAFDYGMHLVPEIGGPAHVGGMLALLKKAVSEHDYNSATDDGHTFSIKYEKLYNAAELYSLFLDEIYVSIDLDKIKAIHFGGDEYPMDIEGGEDMNMSEWFNTVTSNATSAYNKEAWVWNDCFTKSNRYIFYGISRVTYWSQDGMRQDPDEREYLKSVRCTPEELAEIGLSVINCNGYYLYYVPNENEQTSHNGNFAGRDAYLNWDLGVWNGNDLSERYSYEKADSVFIGSAYCIWNENAGDMKPETILKYSEFHRQSVYDITESSESELQALKANAQAGFVDNHYNIYMDLDRIKNSESFFDMRRNGHETLYLLNIEEYGDKAADIWLDGSEHDTIALHDGFIKLDDSAYNERINATYYPYRYKNIKIWVDSRIVIQWFKQADYPYQD